MSKNKKQIFCALPWVHSFVNQNGNYQVCCTSEEYDNNIYDKNRKIFSVVDEVPVDEIMNSNFMKKLRVQMMEGEWPEFCNRCKMTEQLMGVSRRIIENKSYKSLEENLLVNTADDGEIQDLKVISCDYRLGNHCNLQCRMCYPGATKKWIKDWLDVTPKSPFNKEDLIKFQNYDWYESNGLIKDVEQKSQTIEHLHFGGGEPLMSPRMRDILKVYIDNGRANEILLTYNTNITILPKQVLELWPHFKEVRLLVSIDGYGDLNDYIRPPSKWNEIDKNLRYLNDHVKELKITQIMLNTTVQILNVLYLDKICDYIAQFENVTKVPNFIILHHPIYYQINILPEELKGKAFRVLNNLLRRFNKSIPNNQNYLIENILSIRNYLISTTSTDVIHDFLATTEKLDRIHNMNLADVAPDLLNIKIN